MKPDQDSDPVPFLVFSFLTVWKSKIKILQ